MSKYISISVDISDTVDASVRLDHVLRELSDDDLRDEIKKRQSAKMPIIPINTYGTQHIIDCFENPFIADFDKIHVLNNIKDQYILEVEYIKNNL